MTSDSIASFLDLARTHRLLPAEQVDSLFQEPDAPRAGLSDLCDFLKTRGTLTAYQTDAIRDGRGAELSVGGYTLTERLGPCPGGTAYSALHAVTRTPVVLRRVATEALGPADSVVDYLFRAQAVVSLSDPHVAPVIDAGFDRGGVFTVVEPAEGSDLGVLVDDIGAMPANLAVEYGRQAAEALKVVHERGLVHGHVRPNCLVVGPLVPMSKMRPDGSPRMRPAASARVRLADVGLDPLGPPLADGVTDSEAASDPAAGLAFLPPERVRSAERTAPGDVYGLGASLYFLLTDRPPHAADTVGYLVHTIATADPAPLAKLRPDCPPPLVELVGRMMDRDPAARPTAAEVVDRLTDLAAPAKPKAEPEPALPTGVVAPAPVPQPPPAVAGPGSHVEIDFGDPLAEHPPATPGAVVRAVPVYDSPLPPPTAYPPAAYPPAAYPPAAYPPAAYPPAAYPPAAYPPAAVGGYDPAYADDDSSTPIRVRPRDQGGSAWILWVVAGLVLNIIAVLGWIYLFSGNGSTPKKDRSSPNFRQQSR